MTLTAINNSRPYGERALPQINLVDASLVRLLEATAGPDDVLNVGMALNMTSQRLKWVLGGADGKALITQAGFVLMQCQDAVDGLAGFAPEAKQLVIDAVNLYGDTLRASSPLQMEKAQKELAARIMAKPGKRVHRA